MSELVAVVLDTSALIQYACGVVEGLAVAELLAEVEAEGRRVAMSMWALSQALVDSRSTTPAGLEWFLTDASSALVVNLAFDDVSGVVGLSQDFALHIPLAHTAMLALRHEAYVASASPGWVHRVLGPQWPVLDVSVAPSA